MPKHFCVCLSLKSGAVLMSFLALLEGAAESVVATIELFNLEEKKYIQDVSRGIEIPHSVANKTLITPEVINDESGVEGHITLFACCLLLGLLSLFNGGLLLAGLMKAKERYILLYLLLGSTHLMIVLIFSGIYMFKYGALLIYFVVSVFMVYGQIAMYYLFEEISEYNTVKSGAVEIVYNGDAKTYENDGSAENTAL